MLYESAKMAVADGEYGFRVWEPRAEIWIGVNVNFSLHSSLSVQLTHTRSLLLRTQRRVHEFTTTTRLHIPTFTQKLFISQRGHSCVEVSSPESILHNAGALGIWIV